MTGVRGRLRSVGTSVGGWTRRASFLQKWVVLGTMIGIIAGLGGVVFYEALRGATRLNRRPVARGVGLQGRAQESGSYPKTRSSWSQRQARARRAAQAMASSREGSSSTVKPPLSGRASG